MSRQIPAGFSQRIRLEWLELTAQLAAGGASRAGINSALQSYLHDQISVGGNAERGNREKAITILLRTWVSVPQSLRSLRDDALRHIQRLPENQHLILHWGMAMAAYPFFGVIAEVVGRMLSLQGTVGAAQAQRRVREQLGERETVSRAARRVLRSFIDWGVLQDTEDKGVYARGSVWPIDDHELGVWLMEAVLVATGSDVGRVNTLSETPALFPFSLAPVRVPELAANHRLTWSRQGASGDLIMSRRRDG